MTRLFEDISAFLREPESDGIFTSEEYEHIILNFATSRGDAGFTEDEAVVVVRKCEQMKIDSILLGFIMRDIVTINLNDEEELVVGITPEGRAIWEAQ